MTRQAHRGHCENVRWSMKGTESFLSKHSIIEKCLCDFCRPTCISHYPGSPHCLPRVSVSSLPSVLKQFPLFPANAKSHRTFCTFIDSINLFNTSLLNTYCIPGPVLSLGDAARKRQKILALLELTLWHGRMTVN